MILKSALRDVINEVFEEHDVEDGDLADDLLDRLCTTVEVYDDDDDDAEPDFLGKGKDQD